MQKVFREIKQDIIFNYVTSLDFPAHIHDDIELIYIKQGKGKAYCDANEYTLNSGQFFIVFPNQIHRYEGCPKGEYLMLIIKPSNLFAYRDVFLDSSPVFSLLENQNGLLDVLCAALDEFEQNKESPIFTALLTAFFGKLLRGCQTKSSNTLNSTVLQAIDYCTKNYKNDICINDIAQRLNLGRSSISRIFSQRLNISFCDYINSLRLNDAIALLDDAHSITEVAYLSGFPTVRTFNRAFLKRYGISPTQYKKSS